MINSLSLYHPKAKNLPKINGHNLCSTYTFDERCLVSDPCQYYIWFPCLFHVSTS